jgi:hypothetical protein
MDVSGNDQTLPSLFKSSVSQFEALVKNFGVSIPIHLIIYPIAINIS